MRTAKCGSIGLKDVGKTVRLAGWAAQQARRIGPDLAFLPLRDSSGLVQLVLDSRNRPDHDPSSTTSTTTTTTDSLRKELLQLSPETVIAIEGVVRERPLDAHSSSDKTGSVEVQVQSMDILNTADPLPFAMQTKITSAPSEETMLKYRYVDMRKPTLQRNLKWRSNACHSIRSVLHSEGFTEVETPYLFKSTPEGAREFLVPSRQAGLFYALPQSPQQFKQVLMSGGIEKYFQFARCFRDESLGSDRQPEFTQVDLEMSFINQNDIIALIERVISKLFQDLLGITLATPFPQLSYAEAMSKYGSDKPDLRYDMKISDVTRFTVGSDSEKSDDSSLRPFSLDAMVVPKGDLALKRADIDQITSTILSESFPHYGGSVSPQDLIIARVSKASQLSAVKKLGISSSQMDSILSHLNASDEDMVAINKRPAGLYGGHTVMGRVRSHTAAKLIKKGTLQVPQWTEHMKSIDLTNVKNSSIPTSMFNFSWVVDFPLFTPSVDPAASQGGQLESSHHPFTAPSSTDLAHLFTDPLRVHGQHYDLVLNGSEIAGGSIRVHNPHIQRRIFAEILKLSEERIDQDFGHLLDALRFGCPPHGGIAIGFDRLMAIICGASSIREVIAFPKLRGGDLFAGSPTPVPDSTLREYGIKKAAG